MIQIWIIFINVSFINLWHYFTKLCLNDINNLRWVWNLVNNRFNNEYTYVCIHYGQFNMYVRIQQWLYVLMYTIPGIHWNLLFLKGILVPISCDKRFTRNVAIFPTRRKSGSVAQRESSHTARHTVFSRLREFYVYSIRISRVCPPAGGLFTWFIFIFGRGGLANGLGDADCAFYFIRCRNRQIPRCNMAALCSSQKENLPSDPPLGDPRKPASLPLPPAERVTTIIICTSSYR